MLKKAYQLQVGHFTFQINSDVALIEDYLNRYYQPYLQMPAKDVFIDYFISIKHRKGLRRFVKPQVEFFFNDHAPFSPLPQEQATALLEWSMNWVIATQAHQYLIIHAASLEKEGKGIIIAAPSGSGKSTLCAYLVAKGWRLLSDEHALISLNKFEMHALARPINLKNRAIDIIAPFFQAEDFSAKVHTHKGVVSLLKAPEHSIEQALIPVTPTLLVFVNYNPKEAVYIEPIDKATALIEIIKNSFNFGLLNNKGFQCAKELVKKCDAIYLEYSDFIALEQELTRYLSKDVSIEKAS